MGGRYLLTGTQLAMIHRCKNMDEVQLLVDDILKNQFVGSDLRPIALDIGHITEAFKNLDED